jgi:hypothetical protein
MATAYAELWKVLQALQQRPPWLTRQLGAVAAVYGYQEQTSREKASSKEKAALNWQNHLQLLCYLVFVDLGISCSKISISSGIELGLDCRSVSALLFEIEKKLGPSCVKVNAGPVKTSDAAGC